jgi:hypothetical protein
MNVINARLKQEYPANAGRGVAVSPLSEFRADRLTRSGNVLMLLMGAVGFVLLIACANVANVQNGRLRIRAISRSRWPSARVACGSSGN